jgi:hypothetical protein
MTDHSQTPDDAPGVSPATVHHASRVCRALAAGDVDVSGVQFNYTDDSFRVLVDGGDVGTPSDGFDPQGIGGGTIKS